MDAYEFCRWFQGFCELQENNDPPSRTQWILIKQHLQLVYDKITPVLGDSSLEELASKKSLQEAIKQMQNDLVKKWEDDPKKAMPFCARIPETPICSSNE